MKGVNVATPASVDDAMVRTVGSVRNSKSGEALRMLSQGSAQNEFVQRLDSVMGAAHGGKPAEEGSD